MGSVPALLESRWNSGKLVGDAKHGSLIRIRQGYMNHLYQDPDMLDTTPGGVIEQVFPFIWKGHNGSPWQGQWVPTGPWITLPGNVRETSWGRSFAEKGGASLTVVIDNIAANEQTGLAGLYHTLDRGWFSPTRGVNVRSRPSLWQPNEWADVFNGGYQVEIWEGYGQGADLIPVIDADDHWSAPAASKTFVGLIEECDMESHPDHITLTCRDFSVLLTDQRMMGYNKAREIQSPVTFADRKRTLGEHKEFGNVRVSSGAFTTDPTLGAVWSSQPDSSSADTEWIEISLPSGHYEQFYVALPFDGEDMYISLYANGGGCRMDTDIVVPDGWVDLGLGSVPGSGIPYIGLRQNTVAHPSQRWTFGGHTWNLGDNSILRLTFTNLAVDPNAIPASGTSTSTAYRAGTRSMYAFRFGTDPLHPPPGTPPVNAKGWVLVEDAADVIRMILLWAGFHEFDVQNFGWSLAAPMTWGQDTFFATAIDDILGQGNYVFFLDPPTDHDMSIGVPVFRPQSATKPPPSKMITVRDKGLLERIQPKTDLSDLPYVMRFRGAVSGTGHTLFADLVKRYMATYYPPWSGNDYTAVAPGGTPPKGRVAGVRRHFSKTDGDGPSIGLQSDAECLFACILAAIQYALKMMTVQFQIAGRPGIGLDQQISLVDEGTGTNTRMWVASVESSHTSGPNGSWHMVLGGSLIDTEDMQLIADDYRAAYQEYVLYKGGVGSITPMLSPAPPAPPPAPPGSGPVSPPVIS